MPHVGACFGFGVSATIHSSSAYKVLFTAAHAGFSPQLPLGGGATISRWLNDEWSRTHPFDFITLGPGDAEWPNYQRLRIGECFRNLTALNERQYARFCYDFERASTEFILREAERRPVVVLSNDVSEGPNFEALAARGIPIVTIFHVDVVDYFCRFYLRGVRPERMTRWYDRLRVRGLHRAVPRLLRLVFEKQRAAVMHSRSLIVPSGPMKDIILRCYPQTPPERVEVVPWGGRGEEFDEQEVEAEKKRLHEELELSPWDTVLVTLGRLSPEKGIGHLLLALGLLELRDKPKPRIRRERAMAYVTALPSDAYGDDRPRVVGEGKRVRVLICGEAAYMRGKSYVERLRNGCGMFDHIRVDFLGHVTGARKQALLRMASLFVHPSVHESYGLTIVEAMRAGLPVLTSDHYSARELVTDDCGAVAPLTGEWQGGLDPFAMELARLLLNPEHLRAMGACARLRAQSMRFSDAAARVTELLHRLDSGAGCATMGHQLHDDD